jgi:hypothetical protein
LYSIDSVVHKYRLVLLTSSTPEVFSILNYPMMSMNNELYETTMTY